MKIDRQIGILSILLQRERVTAAELAEKYEVSRRTIVRDVEDLNRAGIPIQTMQGQNGGISIMKDYKIDRTVLFSSEMQAILSGLWSLDSVSDTSFYRQLMEKLSANHVDVSDVDNPIIIDLSMWDKSMVSNKIEQIKEAIRRHEQIAFNYFSPSGEGKRVIEPYHLIFQWSSWYVWGYCTMRKDYRMFKLTRITDLKLTGVRCEEREVPIYTCDKLRHTRGTVEVVVQFAPEVKWRLIDEWGREHLEEDAEGNIILHITWENAESLYSWILSFGDNAEILSPEIYRKEFAEIVKKIQNRYKM